MFICLPILFGCQTKIQPDGVQASRICPRCHNASVIAAKATTWFELFWIPLVPISKKHVWLCGVCQWTEPFANNNGPPLDTYSPTGAWVTPAQPAYRPVYISPKV